MNIDTVETVTAGVDAQSPDFDDIVNSWEKYGQDTYRAENGQIIAETRDGSTWINGSRAPGKGGWGSALLNPDEYGSDNLEADFTLSTGGTLLNGFCFNVTKSQTPGEYVRADGDGKTGINNTFTNIPQERLSGYFMTYNNHGGAAEYEGYTGRIHALYRFDNFRLDDAFASGGLDAYANDILHCNPNDNSADLRMWGYNSKNSFDEGYAFDPQIGAQCTIDGSTVTLLGLWVDDQQNVSYNVSSKDGRIKVSLSDSQGQRTVVDIEEDTYRKGTFGFWGSNCEQSNVAYVKDFSTKVTKQVVKSFGDIVYEPEWTDGALHMLINMDTKADSTMLGNDGGRTACERPEPCHGQRSMIGLYICACAQMPAQALARDTLGLTSGLAEDAAEILERDYDIDAGEVLSMNIDTVETITGGIDAQSPNFADVVNSWEKYAQLTFSAAFGDKDGNILERVNADRVTTLPADGEVTKEAYVMAKYTLNGTNYTRTVVKNVPAGKTADQLMSELGLSGVIFSDVGAGMEGGGDMWTNAWNAGKRLDNYGWWGTAILNPDEYEADNIKASFKVVQGGSLNEGFCFNVTKNENITYKPTKQDGTVYDNSLTAHPISGYFWNVSHHGNSTLHRLFKAENWRLDNSFSADADLTGGGTTLASGNTAIWCSPNANWSTVGKTVTTNLGEKFTCLATWTDDGSDIDYNLECSEGRIQIWDTDNGVQTKVADVQDATFTKGTYGFWGNNCEQKGQAQISNLNVEINKTFVKSFGDIVYEPEWTDGALHMLINMDTKADSTMLGNDGGR